MDAFDFIPGVGRPPIRIQQSASGAIGAKLYPGALSLCAYFSSSPLPLNAAVIEVGAGACALPSFALAAAGARVVVTDTAAMLPLLSANVTSSALAQSLRACEFNWIVNVKESAARVVQEARQHCRWGRAGTPSFIVGADVVYHEPLITPLIEALRALTEPASLDDSCGDEGGGEGPIEPPTIILAYIQRFKRARRFFKAAAKYFDVVCVAGGSGGLYVLII